MSIRFKLFLMTLVIFVAVLTMTGVTYVRGSGALNGLLNHAGIEGVKDTALIVRDKLDTMAGVTESYAASVSFAVETMNMDEAGVEELATSVLQDCKDRGVVEAYFGWEKDGKFSIGSKWQEPSDFDARNRPWYKEAVAAPKGSVAFTRPYRDVVTGKTVLTAAKAVYGKNGKLLGVAGSDVDITGISEFVVGSTILGQGTGALVLGDGLIVAHANKDYSMKSNVLNDSQFDESVKAFARRMVAGETGYMDFTLEGKPYRTFFAPVGNGYYLSIFFPTTVITSTLRGLTNILLLLAVLALIVIGAIIFVIVRSLTRSIGNMDAVTARLSAGDLTARFSESGRDELTRISKALNSMVSSISGVMRSIIVESDQTAHQAETLAALSEETLASMEEVAASAERVNAIVEETSSAMGEANTSVQEIAHGAQSSAQSATDGAEQTAEVANVSRSAVEQVGVVVSGILDAQGKSRQSIEQIKNLGHSVEEISGFVDTITSIADQTNLLALNAAIEAARAGEAGRGFAVVAEEVRKLAEESNQAAREVSKLIGTLQSNSQDSISATEETEQLLVRAVDMVQSTQKGLEGALENIAKLNDAIQLLAAVSEEQAAASGEMTGTIGNVERGTEEVRSSTEAIQSSIGETTKAAESIAQAAQGMAETSEKLKNLVNTFTIDERDSEPLALHAKAR